MKYKKELRWLLFLLTPFILMLGIHIFIPLEMVSNTHELYNQNYSAENARIARNGLQSMSIINSQTIQNILEKYLSPVRQINDFNNKQNILLRPSSRVQMSSAFQYKENAKDNGLNRSFKQYSMWFADSKDNYASLSSQQKIIYDEYKKKEAFVRSIGQSLPSTPIQAISTYYSAQNESMLFKYPAKQIINLSGFTYNLYTKKFNEIASQMRNQNINSIQRAFVRQVPQNDSNFLVVCVGSNQKGVIQITCEYLNLTILGEQINSFNLAFGIQYYSDLFLLLNSALGSFGNGSKIIYEYNTTVRKLTEPSNDFFNFGGTNIPPQIFTAKPESPQSKLYLSFLGRDIHCASNVAIGGTNLLSLLTIGSYNSHGIQQADLNKSLNALVVPVVILIIIGSVISAIVLKILLDSIQKQVYQLQHRCQFIVQGDINVEIPEYFGTQDIKQLYDQVKIINKLHRYTISEYFSGHFAQKVLKYNQCLHFLNNLGYDTGYILENIGQAIIYVDEWQKSIEFLAKSVAIGFSQLKQKFGLTLDDAMKLKAEKKALPYGYKEFQIILRRRLFKINYAYIKFVEFRQLSKAVSKADEQAFKNKLDVLLRQWLHYLDMMKKAFYPDFGYHSQCMMNLAFQAKQYAAIKENKLALKILDEAQRYFKIYTESYADITKKLKQKGSKFKIFHMKHKLSTHSRASPDILGSMFSIYTNRIKLGIFTNPEKYNEAFQVFVDSLFGNDITTTVNYLLITDLRKLLIDLKIDLKSFETTQIFKQAVPMKTLYYGQITKEIEPQLLKFSFKASPGMEREYVYLADCARDRADNYEKLANFLTDRANHVFNKHMKGTDRLSIIKFNVKEGIKIQCGLTLKQSNEAILQKEIRQLFRQAKGGKGSFEEILDAFYTAINRVKALQSEKIIIMFFRRIAHYKQLFHRLIRRKKRTEQLIKSYIKEQDLIMEREEANAAEFGQCVIDAMRLEQLRNCKVIFFCAPQDSLGGFRRFFGLQNANRRIFGKYNMKNNLVYIIDDKHRSDIDRILMAKIQQPGNNHVFVL